MAQNPTSNPVMTHQEELVPTGRHDTHLYDPNADPQSGQLMAVYETLDAARTAAARVREAGVPDSAIEVIDRTGERPGAAAEGGFWASIKRLFLPDEDAHGYAESVQRGHAVLVARPALERRNDVVHILEATGPIDFDARLEEWRTAGWNGLYAQQSQGSTGETIAAPGQPPQSRQAKSATTTALGQSQDVVQTRNTPATSGSAAEQAPTGDPSMGAATGTGGPSASPAPGGSAYDTSARPATPSAAEAGLGNAAQTTGAANAGGAAGTTDEAERQRRLQREQAAGQARVRSYAPVPANEGPYRERTIGSGVGQESVETSPSGQPKPAMDGTAGAGTVPL